MKILHERETLTRGVKIIVLRFIDSRYQILRKFYGRGNRAKYFTLPPLLLAMLQFNSRKSLKAQLRTASS